MCVMGFVILEISQKYIVYCFIISDSALVSMCFACRYLNIYVGMPDVEEGFNITKPISPHEVSLSYCNHC